MPLFSLLCFALFAQVGFAQSSVLPASFSDDLQPVRAQLILPETIAPGDTADVIVRLTHEDEWHTYYKHPGEAGVPTSIEWTLPEGWSGSEELRWPAYMEFDTAGILSFGYGGTVDLITEVSAPQYLEIGKTVDLSASLTFLMCDPHQCVPGSAQLTQPTRVAIQTLPVELSANWQEAPKGDPMLLRKSQKVSSSVTLSWALLGGALLGGLILNLMPCVFPILGIKILSFVKQGGDNRTKVILGGLSYSLGIILSLLAIGLVIFALKGAGETLGWGFQLQNPMFVWALLLIVIAVALNLFGVFEIPSFGGSLAGKTGGGYVGNFLSGILMVGLATPCSAPFLAGALGSIFVLPLAGSLTVLAVMGFGLAFPYLLFSLFPSAAKILPKPGDWMVFLKKFLAFPMLMAAGYLLWVFLGQIEIAEVVLGSIIWSIAFAMALWLIGQGSKEKLAILLSGVVLLFIAMFSGAPMNRNGEMSLQWQKWSPELVKQLREDGRPVYVDFTARWCATCQVNKARVFDHPEVLQLIEQNDVALLKADWTNQDESITKELARWGRAAVPFVLIYPADGSAPLEMPELLDPANVIEALK